MKSKQFAEKRSELGRQGQLTERTFRKPNLTAEKPFLNEGGAEVEYYYDYQWKAWLAVEDNAEEKKMEAGGCCLEF